MGKRLIFGVARNDADYAITSRVITEDGKVKLLVCPYYVTWYEMIRRCYSKRYQSLQPTYVGGEVCKEWLLFSNFRKWMAEQQWQEFDEVKNETVKLQLDKDILSGEKRGKLYSPETCLFIPKILNTFLVDCAASRGKYPLGVSWHVRDEVFQAQVRNPFTDKYEGLGYYSSAEEAQKAYIKRKKEMATIYASKQTDPRIAEALLNMTWEN